ncbi:MAG TPA: hypothetical protein VEK73_07465 [Xanthobacteraceae bacterium]|nr:hypothetical protein [Xanthobacteraceae bacterium]
MNSMSRVARPSAVDNTIGSGFAAPISTNSPARRDVQQARKYDACLLTTPASPEQLAARLAPRPHCSATRQNSMCASTSGTPEAADLGLVARSGSPAADMLQ